ncbi:MAG: DedA family protein [Pontiellaceae bacterium]|jgi:membrane protein DedA with SNARE-associated domain|nr:DedA family protein [Pontiellaceae bacterium]
MEHLIDWIVGIVGQWGYIGIVVMMFLESSCFPFPSEVVMIPAGYLSSPAYLNSANYVSGHEMNLWTAVFMGIIGSWLGALFNYYLALLLGRPFLIKWGKYLLISEKNFEKGEHFFRRHGEISTFTGRLIPVIRQYISLPAGIARMNMGHFLFWTGLGAGIWVTILTVIGYVAGQNRALIEKYSREATILTVIGCVIIVVVYMMIQRRRKNRRLSADAE